MTRLYSCRRRRTVRLRILKISILKINILPQWDSGNSLPVQATKAIAFTEKRKKYTTIIHRW